jgi:Na+/proline symporter/nitrogen-specific signal transduction histidine kinase
VTLAPELLLGLSVAYVAMLLAAAHAGDTWKPAERWARHPLAVALSLGVYATSWSYFGSVGMAARDGWRFLCIYLGVTLACTVTPLVWAPLARVLRERQLATLPDLLAFRYQSQALGVIATLFLLAGSLPYQALQQRALVRTLALLGGGAQAEELVGLLSCGALVLFGALYGARNLRPRERHDGLVLAVALESLVKLVALLAAGAYALFHVLDGNALAAHLSAHPEASLARAPPDGSWVTLLLLAFSAAFLLPRQWHLAFTEGTGPGAFRTIAWALPLYLLLLMLSVPLVLWSGQMLDPGGDPDFHVIGLARASGSRTLSALVFLGGLSASTAMILVTAVALASMSLTHLVLPFTGPLAGDLYRRLRWWRRFWIALIVTGGYLVYLPLRGKELADLGLASFVTVVQFLPGLIGVLFWPRATGRGVLAGLLVGIAGWAITVAVPLLVSVNAAPASVDLLQPALARADGWTLATALSLGANLLTFAVVSFSTRPSAAEAEAAAACLHEAVLPAGLVAAGSPGEFVARLAPALGDEAAAGEVERARSDLGLAADERRAPQLRRLRDRVEQNLSGLIGPVLARAVVNQGLTLDASLHQAVAARLHLGDASSEAHALAKRELEVARRYLRRIVEDLPAGVCTVDPSGEIVLWNAALSTLTSIAGSDAVGSSLAALPAPWGPLLDEFRNGDEPRRERRALLGEGVAGGVRDLALVKSEIAPGALPGASAAGGLVLLIEDRTEQYALRARVAHQDRLASIGRLAAGVAHELGNPLTGIASVAQNLQHEVAEPDLRDRLELILEQTRRIDRIVRVLVGFARGGVASVPDAERVPVQVADVVQEAFTLTHLGRAARQRVLRAEVPARLFAHGDRQQLVQILVNLLTNACDASAPEAAVAVHAHRDGEEVVLRVVDRGCGMEPAVRARALEPFFTTKSAGEGTGLGLALVYGLVMEQAGKLALESEAGAGTTVTVRLPAAADQEPPCTAS